MVSPSVLPILVTTITGNKLAGIYKTVAAITSAVQRVKLSGFLQCISALHRGQADSCSGLTVCIKWQL